MKKDLLTTIQKGEVRRGVVREITEFGAFIDLGGIDGLLHITDMSWDRIQHPSELLKVDQTVEVKVLEVDVGRERISLGMKQLTPNPWQQAPIKYPIGSRVKGEVVNIMPYGAFVKLEPGVEGLVHISEMSWTRSIQHPNEVVQLGAQVEVVVLDINPDKQEISLGMKQAEANPWTHVEEKYPPGTKIKGQVRNMTTYGAFVELEEGIDGLLHVSDMSWTKKITHPSAMLKKGDEVEAVVLSVDRERKRVALGLKQLSDDPWVKDIPARFHAADMVNGEVTKLTSFGAFVEIDKDLEGLLHISEMAEGNLEKPEEVVQVGQKLELRIINVDPNERMIRLSLKGVEGAPAPVALPVEEKPAAAEKAPAETQAAERELWVKTLREDTPEAYERYLATSTLKTFEPEARAWLGRACNQEPVLSQLTQGAPPLPLPPLPDFQAAERELWVKTTREDTPEAYERYLATSTLKTFEPEARERLGLACAIPPDLPPMPDMPIPPELLPPPEDETAPCKACGQRAAEMFGALCQQCSLEKGLSVCVACGNVFARTGGLSDKICPGCSALRKRQCCTCDRIFTAAKSTVQCEECAVKESARKERKLAVIARLGPDLPASDRELLGGLLDHFPEDADCDGLVATQPGGESPVLGEILHYLVLRIRVDEGIARAIASFIEFEYVSRQEYRDVNGAARALRAMIAMGYTSRALEASVALRGEDISLDELEGWLHDEELRVAAARVVLVKRAEWDDKKNRLGGLEGLALSILAEADEADAGKLVELYKIGGKEIVLKAWQERVQEGGAEAGSATVGDVLELYAARPERAAVLQLGTALIDGGQIIEKGSFYYNDDEWSELVRKAGEPALVEFLARAVAKGLLEIEADTGFAIYAAAHFDPAFAPLCLASASKGSFCDNDKALNAWADCHEPAILLFLLRAVTADWRENIANGTLEAVDDVPLDGNILKVLLCGGDGDWPPEDKERAWLLLAAILASRNKLDLLFPRRDDPLRVALSSDATNWAWPALVLDATQGEPAQRLAGELIAGWLHPQDLPALVSRFLDGNVPGLQTCHLVSALGMLVENRQVAGPIGPGLLAQLERRCDAQVDAMLRFLFARLGGNPDTVVRWAKQADHDLWLDGMRALCGAVPRNLQLRSIMEGAGRQGFPKADRCSALILGGWAGLFGKEIAEAANELIAEQEADKSTAKPEEAEAEEEHEHEARDRNLDSLVELLAYLLLDGSKAAMTSYSAIARLPARVVKRAVARLERSYGGEPDDLRITLEPDGTATAGQWSPLRVKVTNSGYSPARRLTFGSFLCDGPVDEQGLTATNEVPVGGATEISLAAKLEAPGAAVPFGFELRWQDRFERPLRKTFRTTFCVQPARAGEAAGGPRRTEPGSSSRSSATLRPARRAALVVGIDHYKDANINRLRFAESDAIQLYSFLQGRVGYEARLLKGDEASVDAVLDSAGHQVRDLQAGDMFVFYFSGHGVELNGKHFLLSPECRYYWLKAGHSHGAVPLDLLKSFTVKPGVHRVFILDACRCDVQSGGKGAGSGFSGVAWARDITAHAVPKEEGAVAVLCSCDEHTRAFELAGRKQGLFTGALIDALKEAVESGQPFALSSESAQNLGERMRQIADEAGQGGEQRPSYYESGCLPPLLG